MQFSEWRRRINVSRLEMGEELRGHELAVII